MKSISPEARRNAELAKIHIAKKELGLDDDTYRQMLLAVTGKDSAGKLSARQRLAVLAHLTKSGWQPTQRTRKYGRKPHNLKPARCSRAAQLRKIEALLTVGGRPWKYADVLAKRICKVDSIAWVHDNDLYKVITALRKQAQREGWDLSGEMK